MSLISYLAVPSITLLPDQGNLVQNIAIPMHLTTGFAHASTVIIYTQLAYASPQEHPLSGALLNISGLTDTCSHVCGGQFGVLPQPAIIPCAHAREVSCLACMHFLCISFGSSAVQRCSELCWRLPGPCIVRLIAPCSHLHTSVVASKPFKGKDQYIDRL